MSLKQFANMALQASLRVRAADEQMLSDRYGWMASRRSLTWPSLTATGSSQKSFDDSDTGVETDSRSDSGTLSLSQPLLTGTVLSVDGTWSRSRTEVDSLGLISNSRTKYIPDWTLGIRQPLHVFTGNESWRARREANLQWASDQDGYLRQRLLIEFDARSLYYALLLQNETTAVERRKYESSKLVTETTQALVRAGKLPQVEMVRAEIRARRDERQIRNSENDLEKAMNRARDLVSLPSSQRIKLTSKLVFEPFKASVDDVIKAAMRTNPDVRSARRGVEFAQIAYKRALESDNPGLNATGSYSLTRDRSDPDAPVDPHGWTVGVGVSWPLFDADQTRLRSRQAELSLRGARRQEESAQRDVRLSIENAFLDIDRARQQIEDFGPQRESAERNVRAIRLQYKNGLTRLTDVFDAENQLRELDLEYLNLLVAYNRACDTLKLLVGADVEQLAKGGRQ